jgi:2-dehydropantoate 2-reductase
VRLLVVGPGAIGTLLAARLARAGHELVLLGRPGSPRRPSSGRLEVEGHDPIVAEIRSVTSAAELGPLDGAVLAVKTFDLGGAARVLAHRRQLPVLLPQNGWGVEQLAAPFEPGDRNGPSWVRAISSVPSTWLRPGVVRQAGEGMILLDGAPPADLGPAVARWEALLRSAGLPVRRATPFEREVWRKLLVNAAINPITADHGIENGRLLADPWRGQALALLHEARAVARVQGFEFTREEAEQELFRVVRATASNRSSMLQDLDRGGATEIEAISGAILRLGSNGGIDLPSTRRAVERIRARSATGTRSQPS